MLNSATQRFTPEEVLASCAELWGPAKRRNLMDPDLGNTPWSAMIAVSEGIIEDILRRMVSRANQGWRRRELIAFRRAMDVTFRIASEPPAFYGVPLYVSGGVVEATCKVLEQRRSSNGQDKGRLSRGLLEHVLPLRAFASGTQVIRDPVQNLPGIRRAIVGPICRVTSDENKQLPRKEHPDPRYPFLRYTLNGVEAYRVVDGSHIDGSTYRWEDHVKHMMQFPSYASGAQMLESGEVYWNRVLAETGFRGFQGIDLEEEDGSEGLG